MVSINYAFKEIFAKIVYYGPGLSGKTTNLQYVFKKVPKETRGELISLATDADRTLYFDFLPVNVGKIRGFDIKFQLYTVPGQVYYNATRKLVLRGVDGLVFVADSQLEKMDDNIESFKNLEENLAEYGYNLHEIPFVMQYNKRDLPNIADIEYMQRLINPTGVPSFEAVATTGAGVFATLKAVSKLVIDRAKQSGPDTPPGGGPKAQPPVAPKPVREPEPVAAMAVAAPVKTPERAQPTVRREVASEVTPDSPKETHNDKDEFVSVVAVPEAKGELKPAIVAESEHLANVVVSTTEEDKEKEPVEQHEAVEETTEHSVLGDEAGEAEAESHKLRRHPDVLDADKLEGYYSGSPKRTLDEPRRKFDDEETSISDPHQYGHSLTKPQMAGSKKVKGKKRSGLFGWLKKKK